MPKKQPTSDDKTLQLMQEVKRQKEEIAKIEKPNWKTNCSFSYSEGRSNDTINIHVESNVRSLVMMVAFLIEKRQSYSQAEVVLGNIEAPKFTWGGFEVDDWIEDIKMRISKIQIATRRKKLETLETRLNAVISPELRAAMELEEIEKELA